MTGKGTHILGRSASKPKGRKREEPEEPARVLKEHTKTASRKVKPIKSRSAKRDWRSDCNSSLYRFEGSLRNKRKPQTHLENCTGIDIQKLLSNEDLKFQSEDRKLDRNTNQVAITSQ